MIDPTGHQGRSEQQGLPCPECGALRAPDNTPSCFCARRASEAQRDTRTTEAAAAEDFDPLRIRPYVELGNEAGGESAGASGNEPHAGAECSTGATDVTMPLPAVPGVPPAPPAPGASGVPGGPGVPVVPADATMPLRAVHPAGPPPDTTADMTAALPTPLASSASEPSTTDLSLFEAADVDAVHPYDEEPHRPGRRRALLIATTAAVVAVVAAAGFASGLFSYEKPTRDGAAPQDVRAAVPDASTRAASASASPSRSASPSASEASPSPSESERPSPSASESSASPSASASADAGQATPTARVTGSLAPGNGADGDDGSTEAVVLRRGDKGAEVTELQLRLRQLYLYNGEADGTFTGEVEDALRNYQWSRGTTGDGMGVYGALTRARLESETTEP
ncbi:peptidoglycan-binding domain-containing protein [Streptomyces rishiriensis]|uniref:peptidoglycan-binding domain-containing protein n=1 Tax=Streptomyces rishiriensis TaxID=68264 RepID=UPI0027D7C8FB|nr:peptidoglycan-binding protein [Streptomyces rishiriensis]